MTVHCAPLTVDVPTEEWLEGMENIRLQVLQGERKRPTHAAPDFELLWFKSEQFNPRRATGEAIDEPGYAFMYCGFPIHHDSGQAYAIFGFHVADEDTYWYNELIAQDAEPLKFGEYVFIVAPLQSGAERSPATLVVPSGDDAFNDGLLSTEELQRLLSLIP